MCAHDAQNESFQLLKALKTARNQREKKMYVVEMLDLILLLDIGFPSYQCCKSPLYFLRKHIHMQPNVWISSF